MSRLVLGLGLVGLLATQPAAPLAAQAARAAAQAPKPAASDLPPISYICTMPGDEAVLEDKPGKCPNPKCGMDLKPIRIALAYSCLNNTAFIQETPGKCRTDGTDLVPISASMFWACADAPDKHELNPGKCADGKDRLKKFEVRPHGDHNPRHGGQLFMAPDAWHHIEGAYPSAGLFRVFFYDDWTKPIPPKGFAARAVVKDVSGKEVTSIPLKAGSIMNTMEVRIPNATLPLVVSFRVTFKTGERENLFDFQFPAYTKEPPSSSTSAGQAPGTSAAAGGPRGSAPAATTAARGTAAAARPAARGTPPATTSAQARPATQGRGSSTTPPAPSQPSPAMEAPSTPGTTVEFLSPIIPQEDPIPPTSKEIVAELTAKSEQLASELEQGLPLGQLWVPALRSKNLAVALVNDHLNELPSRQRAAAEDAANRIIRAAFAIDNFGDTGDKDKIMAVHEVFASASAALRAAYATIR